MQIAPFVPEHSAYRPVMQVAYCRGMPNDSPRQVRRRGKLKLLLGDDHGAQALLAAEIGTPKSHLSAILAGRRGMGDALAAKIAKHYGKPSGWMDDEAGAWPFSAELRDRVTALDPDQQHAMERAMWAHLGEDVPKSVAESAKQRLRQLGVGVKSVAKPGEATGTA